MSVVLSSADTGMKTEEGNGSAQGSVRQALLSLARFFDKAVFSRFLLRFSSPTPALPACHTDRAATEMATDRIGCAASERAADRPGGRASEPAGGG